MSKMFSIIVLVSKMSTMFSNHASARASITIRHIYSCHIAIIAYMRMCESGKYVGHVGHGIRKTASKDIYTPFALPNLTKQCKIKGGIILTEDEENTKITPPYMGEKKLIKMGTTIYVQVPPEFLKSNGIDEKDLENGKTVMVMANRDMLVSASPGRIKKAHEQIEAIIADTQ